MPEVVTPPSEREAVARVRRGGDPQREGFRQIYQLHRAEVLRLLARLLRPDEIGDAAQETFVRLHRGLRHDFDPARPLRPYVLRIARNVSIEALRRREKLSKVQPFLDATGQADDSVETREDRALVARALEALTPEHRSAILLRHAHGLSMRDVSEALACSERTVRNRLRAAATLLERELRRLGLGEGEVSE